MPGIVTREDTIIQYGLWSPQPLKAQKISQKKSWEIELSFGRVRVLSVGHDILQRPRVFSLSKYENEVYNSNCISLTRVENCPHDQLI